MHYVYEHTIINVKYKILTDTESKNLITLKLALDIIILDNLVVI